MSQSKTKSGKTNKTGNARRGASSRKNKAPSEGFADFMDLEEEQGSSSPPATAKAGPPPAQTTSAPVATALKAAPVATLAGNQDNGTPSWAWGMLPAACALVTGAALVSALTFLYRGNPSQLWNFSGLGSLHTLYNLNLYPHHVFLAVVASSALLLTLVGYRMGTFIRDLKQRMAAQGELLTRLCALRLDNEAAWGDPIFKMIPETESFTLEILGSWRHQEARIQRVVGLEGELHRLEKAMREDFRDDLAAKYEIPVVGMLADEILQMHDARDRAQEEVESSQAKLGSKGHEVMDDLQNARDWQRQTQDQLNVQEDAVNKASSHLEVIGNQLHADPRYTWDPEDVRTLLGDLRNYLVTRAAPNAEAGYREQEEADTDLLDRLAKLSFQIGMEVARLGARGERLAPMAQALEELNRSFRQQPGQEVDQAVSPAGVPPQILERLEQEMTKLEEAALRPKRDLPVMVQKLGQAAKKAAGNLAKITGSFDAQYERLGRLGHVCADLTGVKFNQAGSGSAAALDLELSQFDPFLKSGPEEDVPVIDPFMERQGSITVQGNALDPFEVSNNILPGMENDFARSGDALGETGLSDPKEKVYDLAEFGAVKLSDQAARPNEADRIYDLSEFAAVRLEKSPSKAAGDERVYDLSEFGARRLG